MVTEQRLHQSVCTNTVELNIEIGFGAAQLKTPTAWFEMRGDPSAAATPGRRLQENDATSVTCKHTRSAGGDRSGPRSVGGAWHAIVQRRWMEHNKAQLARRPEMLRSFAVPAANNLVYCQNKYAVICSAQPRGVWSTWIEVRFGVLSAARVKVLIAQVFAFVIRSGAQYESNIYFINLNVSASSLKQN